MESFKSILFVSNAAAAPDDAFAKAVTLALAQGAALNILVITSNDIDRAEVLGFDEFNSLIRAEAQEKADHLLALVPGGLPQPRVSIRTGKLFIEAIRLVLTDGHDLVIKAAEPPTGLIEKVFGSEDMHLLRKCPCPVWLLRPGTEVPPKCLLVCVALDERTGADEQLNVRLIEMALSVLDKSEQAELHILHLWNASGEYLMRSARTGLSEDQVRKWVNSIRLKHKAWFEDLVRSFAGRANIRSHFEKDFPETRIAELAGKVGATGVVMGTVGRTGISGLLMGNTAETVLHQIETSVLAMKPVGFQTPVQP